MGYITVARLRYSYEYIPYRTTSYGYIRSLVTLWDTSIAWCTIWDISVAKLPYGIYP